MSRPSTPFSTAGIALSVMPVDRPQVTIADTTSNRASSGRYPDRTNGSQDKAIYAVDAKSGVQRWRYETDGPINSSPAFYDRDILVGSGDGKFYDINAQTGQERWHFTTHAAIHSSPVIANGTVYFGGTDGYLYAVDLKTGKERWRFRADAAFYTSPAVAEGLRTGKMAFQGGR